ncbi:MAG: hypothetical protein IJR52_09255 [Selenomonadaceae bacterium]|nr:hypothetical protein [Selenomonadaceae bacterium]MBQ9497742.1 hypothetical protein [Selenomonadaceae bacterium]
MSAELDETHYRREIKRYVEEIFSQLMMLEEASIRVEIKISAPEGIPADTEGTVAANCHALKVKNFQFES